MINRQNKPPNTKKMMERIRGARKRLLSISPDSKKPVVLGVEQYRRLLVDCASKMAGGIDKYQKAAIMNVLKPTEAISSRAMARNGINNDQTRVVVQGRDADQREASQFNAICGILGDKKGKLFWQNYKMLRKTR